MAGMRGEKKEYPEYLTIYAFESKEAFTKYYMTGPEHTAAMEEMKESWKERMYEVKWNVQYEAMRTWGK